MDWKKVQELVINALIFYPRNYCSSICGKCSEKMKYVVQKSTDLATKGASNRKYLKRELSEFSALPIKGLDLTSIASCS